MKFHNNTKFDTQQLRRIVAAVVNRYLSKNQRGALEITVNSARAGSRFKWTEGHIPTRWDAQSWRTLPRPVFCPVLVFPNNATPRRIVFHLTSFIRRWGSEIKKNETITQRNAWEARMQEMPLDEAAPKVANKKDPLSKAEEKLETSKRSSETWKDKLLKAANKVQDYDKKVRYYRARIVLIKKQQRGEVRKKRAPTKKDSFKIVRHKKG
jgi:hypothetical protein